MFKGDNSNPAPNNLQSSVKSGENISVNRANELRRDTDEQKNFTITLLDIDGAIRDHLEKIQLTVTSEGNRIKVPIIYSDPERWAAIQKNNYIRDYNGMVLLPVITFMRSNFENDQMMQKFNRYLTYTVMKKYSSKNRYTLFNILTQKNVPTNDVFEISFPDNIILTYHFIVWTEYVIQMNQIIERIKYETDDYWGDPKRFKFRTKIDSFSHTIEVEADQDRIVKTEFDLIVNGYLLPDIMTKLGNNRSTTTKWMTPKKIKMGIEVVRSDFNFDELDDNKEKWRSQNYPNLRKGDEPRRPVVDFKPDIADLSVLIKSVPTVPMVPIPISEWHFPAPKNSSDPGEKGWQSYDPDYYYIYTNLWKRVPISLFEEGHPSGHTTGTEGQSLYEGEYFYIYVSGNWKRVPIIYFNAYVLF